MLVFFNRLNEDKKLYFWRILGVFFVLIIILVLWIVISFFSSEYTTREGMPDTNILDPGFEVVVTLSDNICHIPGCLKINANDGNTEKMKFGKALGRGIRACPLCVGD